jgi:hypothetical protein
MSNQRSTAMLSEAQRSGLNRSLIVPTLALSICIAGGATAFAHGGGGGGGGHGGGGFGGGGHMGGGFGGFGGHMGGFGGGFGGFRGGFGGGFGRFGGGFGRFGYPGFGFGGFGWGYPWALGYGYGYPYGLGYGYGLGGYGLGGYGYGDPYYGYGMGYPYSGFGGYGGGFGYPSYGYGVASMAPPVANAATGPGFGYSAAYVAPGSTAPSRPLVNGRRILGIDEEPVVLSDGRKAMKITNVYTGTGASIAGLQVGDVLISVNGYLTEQRGNLAWIIANATPGDELKLIVRTAKDGKDHTVMATI